MSRGQIFQAAVRIFFKGETFGSFRQESDTIRCAFLKGVFYLCGERAGRAGNGGREDTEGALMPFQVVKRSEPIALKLGR